uniref:Epidermal growth factor receptor pathway substrate 15 n=1 Tax=Cyclopterus lumpus TaxID=8103 RepID=A0A8C2X3H2_CYCLU
MAATLSLTQLSNGNPIYDKHYRQVDPTGSGRVAAADAALFLKRSGLADLVLGKVWDLADSERKGALNKQQFFIALRLVACAQNGLEVALRSLNVSVPPPKFHDTSSPQLAGGVAVDNLWVVKPEEKLKFDAIFESLGPTGGILTGDKVKPVLLNSKLPVDILGRAMYLVYRALEGEPVPMSLPPPLVPPSKRKKPSWVVSPADKAKYDELFSKTDGDMDGLVSGPEVRDIFLKTGLPSATLARIWELCDIGDIGKLTREQFALALHLINQRLTKGLEPPQSLAPEMIPPSDRQNVKQVGPSQSSREKSSVEEEIKEKEEAIRQRSNEVQDLQVEVAKESEELQRLQAQRQKVQDALEELDQQKGSLEEQLTFIRQQTNQEAHLISSLQSEHEDQEQKICQFEEELVQAREELLALQEESRKLQEKVQAAEEQLTPLQESVRDSFTQVSQVCLCESMNLLSPPTIGPIFLFFSFSLTDTMSLLHSLYLLWISFGYLQNEVAEYIFVLKPQCVIFLYPFFIDDPFKDDPFGKADVADPFGGDPFKGSDPFAADSFFQAPSASFASDDPFTASSADLFGTTVGVPEPDLFATKPSDVAAGPAAGPDPFSSKPTNPAVAAKDPFSTTGNNMANSDLFGGTKHATGEADPFGSQEKGADPFSCSLPSSDLAVNLFLEESQSAGPDVPPALPPKTGTPTRPPPPPPGKRSAISRTDSSESFQRRGPFLQQPPGDFSSSLPAKDPLADPFAPSSPPRHNARETDRFASFDKYPTEEDMIEWAKRESEREEKERLARLTQQEQEDLELAIALSQSELS